MLSKTSTTDRAQSSFSVPALSEEKRTHTGRLCRMAVTLTGHPQYSLLSCPSCCPSQHTQEGIQHPLPPCPMGLHPHSLHALHLSSPAVLLNIPCPFMSLCLECSAHHPQYLLPNECHLLHWARVPHSGLPYCLLLPMLRSVCPTGRQTAGGQTPFIHLCLPHCLATTASM